MTKLEEYYDDNQKRLDDLWQDHISFGEWGSGEDAIVITDKMFWQFVEEQMYEEEEK